MDGTIKDRCPSSDRCVKSSCRKQDALCHDGATTFPLCKDQAHFRRMKDPVLVARSRIDDHERFLIA